MAKGRKPIYERIAFVASPAPEARKALAADPDHALTWSYYGMWHAEQGNLLKARDHLTKVASICGTGCREYVMLKEVIEGTRAY